MCKKICEGMLTVEVSEVNFTEFHPTNVLHKVWSALALGISFFNSKIVASNDEDTCSPCALLFLVAGSSGRSKL